MPSTSKTHLILIPAYNPGFKVYETVKSARNYWEPVWVIVDGSTDGTTEELQQLASSDPGLQVFVLPKNRGKGAAVLYGLERAQAQGFTHALTMDSDGQHPALLIQKFMESSMKNPEAMILGLPVFDATAPSLRVKGRRISNAWTHLETLWGGIGDSLFGFRVYPIKSLVTVMQKQYWMRRFDFDVEAAVRLSWKGIKSININAPVRYFSVEEGGVSHFNYWRDNVLLSWMHLRLLVGFIFRLPLLIWRKFIN
ncbi:MAG: glycosyltransferase family 2 protein [Burkholderiaceae bacterium]|nr:glycosyltransferase family 2 protein [Burkholderiaceae bacterium]